MEKIKTATGKAFGCDFVGVNENPNRLYLRICQTPLATVASVFGDPRETVQLYYGEQYFAHYTKLLAIIPENGAVRVNLTKE